METQLPAAWEGLEYLLLLLSHELAVRTPRRPAWRNGTWACFGTPRACSTVGHQAMSLKLVLSEDSRLVYTPLRRTWSCWFAKGPWQEPRCFPITRPAPEYASTLATQFGTLLSATNSNNSNWRTAATVICHAVTAFTGAWNDYTPFAALEPGGLVMSAAPHVKNGHSAS